MSDESVRGLTNVGLVACFTTLAIAFGKWQLVLLVILFWNFKKED